MSISDFFREISRFNQNMNFPAIGGNSDVELFRQIGGNSFAGSYFVKLAESPEFTQLKAFALSPRHDCPLRCWLCNDPHYCAQDSIRIWPVQLYQDVRGSNGDLQTRRWTRAVLRIGANIGARCTLLWSLLDVLHTAEAKLCYAHDPYNRYGREEKWLPCQSHTFFVWYRGWSSR